MIDFESLFQQEEKAEEKPKKKVSIKKASNKKLKSSTTDKRVNQNMDRKLRVASCEQCNGNPETYEGTIPGFSFIACKRCGEVIEYKKE